MGFWAEPSAHTLEDVWRNLLPDTPDRELLIDLLHQRDRQMGGYLDYVAPDDRWVPYTPTWSATAGSPAIGNGGLTGRYSQQGRTVDLWIELVAGSTTTYGTAGATWLFTLPVIYPNPTTTTTYYMLGVGLAYDSSAAQRWQVLVEVDPTNEAVIGTTGDGAGNAVVGATGPFTWAQNDILRLQVRYEID